MNALLLAIDVGNTETKLGIFEAGQIRKTWRVRTQPQSTADEYAVIFAQLFALHGIAASAVESVVMASVVPSLNQALFAACKTCFDLEPIVFGASQQRLMEIVTERPGEVGADLIAAAIAARARRGAPVIVVMYGTATTIAAVNADGAYSGVAIAPGIQVALDALIGRAAKLPQIALAAPKSAIGRTTVTAMQSGVFFGTVAQTEGMVARFRVELGCNAPVVASGGLAEIIAKESTMLEAVPSLVLEGLALYVASLKAQ